MVVFSLVLLGWAAERTFARPSRGVSLLGPEGGVKLIGLA
jgi:hypothetical protein